MLRRSSALYPISYFAAGDSFRSSTPFSREIVAEVPQATHISHASQETAAVWGDLVSGTFWQKALFRAYLERVVEARLYLHMEASLQWDPGERDFTTMLRKPSDLSGVALPTVAAETQTEPYYVAKNLRFSGLTRGFLSSDSTPDPVWEVVYEAPHSHRDVFRIARSLFSGSLSQVLGLEAGSLSDQGPGAQARWELARLLIAAEDKVDMNHLANLVDAVNRPVPSRGSLLSPPPIDPRPVNAELQRAVAIGRGQEIS